METFIFESGGSCIHVAKVYIVGNYMNTKSQKYSIGMTSMDPLKVNLSNFLNGIVVSDDDDIFVADTGRQEVVILRRCITCQKCAIMFCEHSEERWCNFHLLSLTA